MASAGSIFVDLLLRDANFQAGLNRARKSTGSFSGGVQSDIGKVRQSFVSVLSPINNVGAAVARLSGVLAGALSTQKLVQYSDTWKQLEGRLSIVSANMAEVNKRQEDLFEIAQRTRQPLEGIMSFYTRLTQFIPEAERQQYDLLGVTESIATALAITGESGASATAAMIQFTQAIGTNFEAAGQELRSLQEQAPRLTKALMDALGGGTKSLQQLKEEGLLTRESVLSALSGMGAEGQKLRAELEKVSLTVGQAFGRLDNAFLKYIGQSESVTAGTNSIALAVSALAENLDLVANALVTVAAIMIGRVVVSFAAATSQAVLYQIALLKGLGVTRAVATGLFAVNVASRAAVAGLALLGGIPGIIITAVAAIFIFRKEILSAADNINVFGVNVGNVFRDIANGAGIIFKGIQAIVLGFIAGSIEAFKGFANSIKLLTYNVIQDLNRIPGVNISADDILADLTKPGAFESSQRSIAENYKRGWDRVSADISSDIAESLFPSAPRAGIGPTSPLTSPESREKEVASIEKWLIKQREALETLRREADYIGLTSIEVEKLRDARNFEAQVAERSYGLKGKQLEAFRQEAKAIQDLRLEVIQTNYEISRSAEAGFSEFFSKYVEDARDSASQVRDLLTKAFKGAEDAFVEFTRTGKLNFKDMANSIIEDLIRIQFRRNTANLIDGLLGGGSGGGGSGGLFGNLLGGLGGLFGGAPNSAGLEPIMWNSPRLFADGGYLEPGKFGIAGEAGAELIYGGKTGVSVFNQDQLGRGGNTYYIDARGADQSAITRLEQSLLTLAGPGVIESRVNNAQVRGML